MIVIIQFDRNILFKSDLKKTSDWFSLAWFYGISTIVGHLMPNPVYTSILDIYNLLTIVKKVKWFQVFLCITNNSIKQSFI